jgi:16S rRNA (cytidine1402-2'-O)-methyltransferase
VSEIATLYIVPTPIGNLEDITFRAIAVLSSVDIIAAEDTRHSQKLLQHYSIQTRLISLHDHNEGKRTKQIIEHLQSGKSIALISDAGTPLISDPGYTLVNECRKASLNVVALPGACAAITALSAAGLATDRFRFEGFLPVKMMAKQQALQKLLRDTCTCIFYESPRRISTTVSSVVEVLGKDRKVVVAKEITKTFETYFSGTAEQALEWLNADSNHQRGEFVLLISGYEEVIEELPQEAIGLLQILMQEMPLKKAAAITAKHYELKKNALYQLGLSFNDKE